MPTMPDSHRFTADRPLPRLFRSAPHAESLDSRAGVRALQGDRQRHFLSTVLSSGERRIHPTDRGGRHLQF